MPERVAVGPLVFAAAARDAAALEGVAIVRCEDLDGAAGEGQLGCAFYAGLELLRTAEAYLEVVAVLGHVDGGRGPVDVAGVQADIERLADANPSPEAMPDWIAGVRRVAAEAGLPTFGATAMLRDPALRAEYSRWRGDVDVLTDRLGLASRHEVVTAGHVTARPRVMDV